MNRKLRTYLWLLSAVALFICITPTKAQQGQQLCPSNATANAETGVCSAIVNDIAPRGNGNNPVQYTLTGATTGSGNSRQGASGLRFNVGVTTVVYRHGNQSCQFTVTVLDNQKPTASNPSPVEVQCKAHIPAPDPGVVTDEADNCGGTTVTFRGETNNGGAGCPGSPYIVTRTYRITDGSENFTDVTQTITVIDNTAPVITQGSIGNCYKTEEEAEAAAIAATQATDNCSGTVTRTATTEGDCAAVITVTATDACGNSSTATYNTRIDNTAPVITPGTIGGCYKTKEEAEAAAIAATMAEDNCEGTVTFKATSTMDGCAAVITVTANDACGNSSTVVYNTRVDNEPPKITPGTIGGCYKTEEEAEAAAIAATRAEDNCGGRVTFNATSTTDGCAAVITVTATDACGNSSTTTYNTRIDNTGPVITQGSIGSCYKTKEEAEAAAIAATRGTDNCGGTVTHTVTTAGDCAAVITVTSTDACGNSSIVIYNTRIDKTAPVVANCPANMTASTGPDRSTCDQTVTWIEPTAVDNCSGVLSYTSRSHAPGSVFPVGSTVVTYTFEDACGNRATCTFTVTVSDNTPPEITCPENIRLSACEDKATWTAPAATDNCPGVTVAQTGGPRPGSSFANGTTTPITYTATDAAGNQASCSFTVTRAPALGATCTSTATQLYFGLEDYQSAIITGTATGGTGPYTITIAMNRPLICNSIDDAGDESFTGIGGQTENGNCLTRTSNEPPVATMTNVLAGPYGANVTLLQNATFTITVTDADGCTATCTVTVNAEDVRCFAGRSDIHKVTMCHRTNSLKNPCVTICVDESSVATHLAHGDYIGECNTTCTPPVEEIIGLQKGTGPEVNSARESFAGKLMVTATPNPSSGHFTVRTQSSSTGYIQLRVLDLLGRVIETRNNLPVNSVTTLAGKYRPGVYLVEVIQGTERQVLRLLKY